MKTPVVTADPRQSPGWRGWVDARPGYVVDHVTPLKHGAADIPSNVWYVVSHAGKILFKGPYENATRYLNNLRKNFPAIKADIFNTQGLTPSHHEASSVEKFEKIAYWDPTGGELNEILSWPGKAPKINLRG